MRKLCHRRSPHVVQHLQQPQHRAAAFSQATDARRKKRIQELYDTQYACADHKGTSTSLWRSLPLATLPEDALPWRGWLHDHSAVDILPMLQQVCGVMYMIGHVFRVVVHLATPTRLPPRVAVSQNPRCDNTVEAVQHLVGGSSAGYQRYVQSGVVFHVFHGGGCLYWAHGTRTTRV